MKLLDSCIYVGSAAASTLLLTYMSASIFGNHRCQKTFEDWKVMGTISSIGSFLGSYYYNNKY
jgi:hypothetical protein